MSPRLNAWHAGAASDSSSAFTALAQRSSATPVLDGDVLEDAAWKSAVPASGFWQTTPNEGDPSSENTEVRIIYDEETLYIGVVCYDANPDEIIVSDSRRDASLSDSDCFQLILDTFNDSQNGFLFATNPAGIEHDAQITNEGQGGGGGSRQIRGSGGGVNRNWDGAWQVKTQIGSYGWSAEFAIPFKTLRFTGGKQQTWGINFQRNIRRRNETAYWAKLPRQYDIHRLSLAGKLKGLDLKPPLNLKFMPYVLGDADREYSTEGEFDYSNNIGVDVKYSLTPGLTLDLTYNTDFAQVEVDEQQINLDRFNLFFPEKRPFFLENAGLFSVGSSGEVEMFFSRSIGIGDDGQVVPILGGGRISGKVRDVGVGILNMQTESLSSEGISANNFSVLRLHQEFGNRSAVGVLFTNRQATGSDRLPDDHGRTLALDGRLGFGTNGQFYGFAAKTQTPDISGSDHAYQIGVRNSSQAWRLSLDYTEVASGFNPEMGFLSRSAFRKVSWLVFNRSRMQGKWKLHEARPHVSYSGYWDLNGFQETGFLHVDTHWEFASGHEIHTGVNFRTEGIRLAPGEDDVTIQGVVIPQDSYHFAEAQLVAFTNRGAPASVSTRVVTGGFFGGNRLSVSNTLRLRVGNALTSELNYNFNDANLQLGDFRTHLWRLRASYSFTPRIYLQALLQYNDSSDIWSTNLRFGWLDTANTGLFLVYNETQDILDGALQIDHRSFILKYSRLFDVFR